MTMDLAALATGAGLTPASIVVADLTSGRVLGALEPEAELYPASMIKVPLAAAVFTAAAGGAFALDARIEVAAANLTANDAPSPLVPGYVARVDELCDLAIARSDNVATNILFDVVGRERATQIARHELGLRATRFSRKLSGSEPLIEDPEWDRQHRNAHPAADAARLFRAIALDGIAHADRLRAALRAQHWNDKLSLGIRDGDVFMHKTGDTDEVTHDGGILLTATGRAYAIVVYAGFASSPANNARFGPFMERLRALLA